MALREINIADPVMIQRQMLSRHLTFWGVCLLLILALIGAYYLYQTRVVLADKTPTADRTEMQRHIMARIEKINKLKAELESLESRQGVIEALAKGKPFAAIVAELAQSMNDETWLSRMDITGGKEGEAKTALILDGFTLSNAKLGEFINNLNRSDMFTEVNLKFANEVAADVGARKSGQAHKSVQFQIVCAVAQK